MTPDPSGAPAFERSRECLEEVVAWLEGDETATAAHAELEAALDVRGRELLRLLLQDHLDLRAEREVRITEVTDADGTTRGNVEAGHERSLATIFGEVVVRRLAYRRRGHANLHPCDAVLNLPEERHSHGLRRLAAVESSRGSFDDAVDAIGRATGQHVAKRQVEDLAERGAADFEDFYARRQQPGDPGDVLVISADGKGIVMRPEALRPATAHAASRATNKLETRLSKGEKRNRKRMAEVGAVYDITPMPRSPAHILAGPDGVGPAPPAPTATSKWLTASVVDDASTVIGKVFDEAERRDPRHQRTWIALVDGNNHQIEAIHAEAHRRDVTVSVLIDFIHVLEYLWRAAWCFHDEADPAAEAWVRTKALSVLNGRARSVAGSIRRHATNQNLDPNRRANADTCANYLTNKSAYLDYRSALTDGWPIATGVIEGACRHLVKDRMDLTGARWGLQGAEAVLKLRALHSNGDFDDYWPFHLAQQRQRVHQSRYADNRIPQAA
jgi:hypothetical protein